MNILEKEIEELIFDALVEDPTLLQEKGLSFEIDSDYLRQPDLGAYGRPDVVGYTVNKKICGIRHIHATVFEFKKEGIDANTLMQAARYRTAIEQYVKSLKINRVRVNVDMVLIGKTIQRGGDFVFLLNAMELTASVYTYKLSLADGLTFDHHCGYVNLNPNFKTTKLTKDRIKELLVNHNPSLVSYPQEDLY